MFDILFGWRKASKCKKLIKTVQCRVKLLKNKRGCIVNQLRKDVSELLKHGHNQTAFQRVEQVITDESMVKVYDLLEQFCEFILLNISYIRKHRDCPNDINEAASTLIFSSARIGELPELLSIRKLFGERYGQRFILTALELLPGNLVNQQIKENLCIKKVSDDVKYRLLHEIGSSCIQPGLLFLEYKPELQEHEETKGSSCEVELCNDNESRELELYIGGESEGKIICVDSSSENRIKIQKDTCVGLMKFADCNEMEKLSETHTSAGMALMEYSSETSAKLPEEIIYLDDIEEFVSPVSKDGNLQDQRLFMFKSFGIRLNEKTDRGIDTTTNILKEQKRKSRSCRKKSRKRTRRGSVSRESTQNVLDIQCASYYGEPHKSDDKILVHETDTCFDLVKKSRRKSSGDIEKKYSLENPRYLRAMTMPAERPKESDLTDNINRSNSFPLELPHCRHSWCRHIHPKLPDYDELAAKFMELKRANLQNKQQLNNVQT